MWVDIHGRGTLIDMAVQERVESRLRFTLGRFGDFVGRVTVNLTDVNGPHGGLDKRCRVVVEVLGHGRTTVEDTCTELGVAIDQAADRVGQAVRRRLDRARYYYGYAGRADAERN